ncbi:sensor histidine kinase [Nonomuraea mesophila]|uniref:histidine kinase n=1 Tax=Nonomuraea mesophila TaxID=2530382 RepID=A0A4R5F2M9_9ACTN|nr:sensor histidine kinase [Nonomuraea mesophila]TDE41705.1 sensor histidine kinase [Nonomuraea mesophila]
MDRRTLTREGLLVLAATALLIGLTLLDGGPPWPAWPFLTGLSLAAALVLTLRTRFPLAGALLAVAVVPLGLQVPGWPGRLVTMAMFGAAAFHLPRRLGLVAGLSVAWTVGYALLLPAGLSGVSIVTDLVVMGAAPVAVGHALRLRGERARQAALLDRAEAGRAMAEERAGLARDVHDSVGHHLTAIRLQATATRRALRGAEPAADRALGTIADLSSSALAEVRALLDTLRDEPAAPGRRPAAIEDLAAIEGLARRLSAPGLNISVHRAGSSAPLPPGVGGTVYRVVQEALTNAVRHSGATDVQVRIRRGRVRVAVTIADNGPPGFAAGAEGRGLRGMRERVLQHGGTLQAGPGRTRGWLVEATVPAEESTG